MTEHHRIVPGNRAENRAAMEAEILRLGREHLTSVGASALSLRAVARDLGVASSAVYRYVSSRDELLTKLVVEAYNDLADAAARAIAPIADPGDRLRATALAMRAWAVADPPRWALLYGSPVIGYAAPADLTTVPGTRVIALVLAELAAAGDARLLRPDLQRPPAAITTDLQRAAEELQVTTSASVVAAGTLLWSVIIGGISLEVFGQYGDESFSDPEALFAHQIRQVLASIFVDAADSATGGEPGAH
ncbi:TetR/AcrR family transcriptional regulator [Naumannella halotolerans]|uniref:AcrR family transcriptional regulator n=1 Tax=Naumannella halotolerans TaxID=993414 RepID=A0A4R7IWK8_9ACTN|nr:TetR/AcrR family transcriptional regulator [Naumannella halotolerans]TDT29051.1 AcrR family transcriptional regulator [Naumannella halotolerans]